MTNATSKPDFTHRTGESIKVTVSATPAFFPAVTYGDDHRERVTLMDNDFDKGIKLEIPADTPWQLCAFSTRPDVYMLAVYLPNHPQARRNGLVGVVLRNSSYRKLRANDTLRRKQEREAEEARRPYDELPQTDINGIRHAPEGFELKFENPFLGRTKRHSEVIEALPVGTQVGVWVSEMGAYRFHTGTLVEHTSGDAKGSLPDRYFGDDIAQVTIEFDEPKPWTFDMRTTEDRRDVQLNNVFSAVAS